MASYVLKKPLTTQNTNAPYADLQTQYQNSLLNNQANALLNHANGTATSQPTTATGSSNSGVGFHGDIGHSGSTVQPTTTVTGNASNASGTGTNPLDAVTGTIGNALNGLASAAQNLTPATDTTPATPDYNADYMAQLSAMLQAQQAYQQQQLAANQAAHAQLVQNAYANNMNNLNSYFGNYLQRLDDTYNGTVDQLDKNYNASADKLNTSADNALREAYINRMLSEKNLSQKLNAAGLTGGAAESTIAGLLNNYGNARSSIETERLNNLADLLNTYQNNLLTARQKYDSAKSDAESQNYSYLQKLENDLASGLIGTYDDLYSALNSGYNTYANAMQGLAASQVGNAADLAAANYKNALNAQAKAADNESASGGALASAISSSAKNKMRNEDLNKIAQKVRTMIDPQLYVNVLVDNGTITEDEAYQILNAAGL